MRKFFFILILSGLFYNHKLHANDLLQYTTDSTAKNSPILQFIANSIKPFLEARIDAIILKTGFNAYLKKIIEPTSHLKIEILKEGIGDQQLICGQMAEIDLALISRNGKHLSDQEKILLTVGLSGVNHDLDLGIIDMKIGEERLISMISPSSKTHQSSNKNEVNQFQVKLRQIINNQHNQELQQFKSNNFKYYDILTNLAPKISCGDWIKINLKVLNAQGETLLDNNKSSSYILGTGSMPIILENGLIGMAANDIRLIFANPNDLKLLKDLKINDDKGVILEVTPELID